MNVVFDGPAQPIGLALHSLLGLLPLAVWGYERYVRKRPATVLLPIIGFIWLIGTNAIQIWDQTRVRKMVESSQDVRVTRGFITESWHIETRTRDWTRGNLSYKTTVSEGFDVGSERFKWNIGDSFSAATFSNSATPALAFPKGTPIEVTWFLDSAAEDSRRIIRLRMGDAASATDGKPPAKANTDFTGFLLEFKAAFDRGDKDRLSALTRFPVQFASFQLQPDQVMTLWAGLLTPLLQSCVRDAQPSATSDGGMRLDCPRTTLIFHADGKGIWRFTEVREGT